MFTEAYEIINKNYIYVALSAIWQLSFLMGAIISWTSPMVAKLQSTTTVDYPLDKHPTNDQISWLASAMALGSILGPLVLGKLPDFIGRKNALLVIVLPIILAQSLFTFSQNIYVYITGRFLCGFSFGAFVTAAFPYVGEICHTRMRGSVNSCNLLVASIGSIFSLSVGPYASAVMYNSILFALSIIVVVVFYLLAVESPFYLILKKKENLALECLEKLRGYSGDDVEKEFEDIKLNVNSAGQREESVTDLLVIPAARKAFVLVLTLSLLHQLTGIAVIMTYAESFFKQANTSIPPEICAIILGVVQFASGLITPFTCDKFGRKTLLYASSISLSVPLAFLGVYFHFKDANVDVDNFRWAPIACLVLCVTFSYAGLAMVPSIIVGEIFPMSVKCVGTTLVMTIMNIEVFLVTKYIYDVADKVGMAFVCWFFAMICVIICLYVKLFLIETKGKSMNEIQDILENKTANKELKV